MLHRLELQRGSATSQRSSSSAGALSGFDESEPDDDGSVASAGDSIGAFSGESSEGAAAEGSAIDETGQSHWSCPTTAPIDDRPKPTGAIGGALIWERQREGDGDSRTCRFCGALHRRSDALRVRGSVVDRFQRR
jgi:hypothetical protein